MKVLTVPSSGSLAGQTASRNRFGQYLRTRAVPVNPNSPRQTAARAILSGCSANWATLNEPEQASWAAWAALHPRTDSLGSVVTMTGAQAFNSVNCLLVGIGLAAVSVPPADPLPDPPAIGVVAIEATLATVAFTPTPVPAATSLVIFGSPPVSLGTRFFRDFRYLIRVAPAGVTPANVFTAMVGKWGTPSFGQRYAFRAKLVRADGGSSAWSNIVSSDVAP